MQSALHEDLGLARRQLSVLAELVELCSEATHFKVIETQVRVF